MTEGIYQRPLSLAISLRAIDEQRVRGWTDFHPEEFCHRCGGINVPSWAIDSDRFNAAMGAPTEHRWNGIICPGCFVVLHEQATGMTTTWTLTPWGQVSFRHIADERDT